MTAGTGSKPECWFVIRTQREKKSLVGEQATFRILQSVYSMTVARSTTFMSTCAWVQAYLVEGVSLH